MEWVGAAAPAPRSPTYELRLIGIVCDQGGMDQGINAAFVSRLDQPPLNDRPDIELESLGHGTQEDRLVLGHCTKM